MPVKDEHLTSVSKIIVIMHLKCFCENLIEAKQSLEPRVIFLFQYCYRKLYMLSEVLPYTEVYISRFTCREAVDASSDPSFAYDKLRY